MPLIPQQDILTAGGRTADAAVAALRPMLDRYPECRIVSISISPGAMSTMYVVAVVETV